MSRKCPNVTSSETADLNVCLKCCTVASQNIISFFHVPVYGKMTIKVTQTQNSNSHSHLACKLHEKKKNIKKE